MKKVHVLKKWHLIAFAVVLLCAVGYKAYLTWYWPATKVKIADQEITVLVANSFDHRFQGLSNRKDLGGYGGMLFVFEEDGRHPMVMRDMLFSLDMLWIKNGKIVDMAQDLAPEPGIPENLLNLYMSRGPSNVVLELPAGFIAKNGLKIGDEVTAVK